MPNTKSAERRMRNSARKYLHNQPIKSRLKTLERRYADAVKGGKREEPMPAYRLASSALDKGPKSGGIRRAPANPKKPRRTAPPAPLQSILVRDAFQRLS